MTPIMLNGNTPPFGMDLELPGVSKDTFQKQMQQLIKMGQEGKATFDASMIGQIFYRFKDGLDQFENELNGKEIIESGFDAGQEIMDGHAIKGILKYTAKVAMIVHGEAVQEAVQDKALGLIGQAAGMSLKP